jgi:hypothetical protein
MGTIQKLSYAAIAALCMSLCSCNRSEYLIPVQFSENGRWSMINSKGEVVYDAEFKNQPTLVHEGIFSVEETGGITVYRSDKKTPTAVNGLENLKSAGFMNGGLMPVVYDKSRITIVDNSGNKKFELTPYKNEEIVSCQPGFSDDMLMFKTSENKYGYYNKSGEIAIKPEYEDAYNFSEDLAVVAVRKNKDYDDSYEYKVINKKGETVFKLKSDCKPDGRTLFYKGHIIVENNEGRFIVYDKNGEFTKLPEKIHAIVDYNEDYIIYMNEDYECGIVKFNGESITRAKYSKINFDLNNKNKFFAVKSDNENEIVVLNSKGEELNTKLEYSYIIPLESFGYLVKDEKRWTLLNDKLKPRNNDEYYDFGLNICLVGEIESDYIDLDGIADEMVSMIDDKNLNSYNFGSLASNFLYGKNPSNYTYTSEVDLDDLSKQGFRYNINAKAFFSETLATYDWYSGLYLWNPDSKLMGFGLTVKTDSEWDLDGQKALIRSLKKNGYTILKEGSDRNDDYYTAIFEKGGICVIVHSQTYMGVIGIFDKLDEDTKSNVLQNIVPYKEKNYSYESVTDEVDTVSIATEEVVEVPADYEYAPEDSIAW